MLSYSTTATMMTAPVINFLKPVPVSVDPVLAYLVDETDTVRMQFRAEQGGETVVVTDRRIVWMDPRGGMMGKRIETYSVRLRSVATVATLGVGGLTGESEIKLGIPGLGDITLGFHKDTDVTALVAHLTRFAGALD